VTSTPLSKGPAPSPTARLLLPLGLVAAAGLLAWKTSGTDMASATRVVGGLLPPAAAVALWLALAYLANRLVGVFVWDGWFGRRGARPVPRLIVQMTGIAIYACAGALILTQVFGGSLTGILAASGVVGVVAGIALRGVLADVFFGIAMNMDRAVGLGDWVELTRHGKTVQGQVDQMNWRATHLVDRTGDLVVVPNSEMASGIVINRSRPAGVVEAKVSIPVDAGVPADRAIRILSASLLRCADQGQILADPAPFVLANAVQSGSVEYALVFFLDPDRHSPGRAQSAVLMAALRQLSFVGLAPAAPATRQVPTTPLPARDGMPGAEHYDLVARIPLFAPLDAAEVAAIAGRMAVRSFPRGATLMRAGEPGETMMVLMEGALDVVIPMADGAPDGTPGRLAGERVAGLWPGDCFGEMSLLTGAPRAATIVAATDCVAGEIDREQMGDLFARNPALVDAIAAIIAERQAANEAARRPKGQGKAAHHPSLTDRLTSRIRGIFGV